jgi:hypothetical protein
MIATKADAKEPGMTWEEHLAWCRQRSLEHLGGELNLRNAAASMLSDLMKHAEFEDRCGRALRGKICKSQGLDFIIDGSGCGDAFERQWIEIYKLASPRSFVDFVVEAIDEALSQERSSGTTGLEPTDPAVSDHRRT